ncbi:MAG: transglycosylase SLT domain-containing protein [Candidatus Pacebacteria bacterium]|nr:transglycosylase SLT domain-containing protein [Candidatus Paceibacterota bacterium]MCF7862401.1 transglycosylase SLT domain-containing protein [Candidatus Paceibacterota bacterium]
MQRNKLKNIIAITLICFFVSLFVQINIIFAESWSFSGIPSKTEYGLLGENPPVLTILAETTSEVSGIMNNRHGSANVFFKETSGAWTQIIENTKTCNMIPNPTNPKIGSCTIQLLPVSKSGQYKVNYTIINLGLTEKSFEYRVVNNRMAIQIIGYPESKEIKIPPGSEVTLKAIWKKNTFSNFHPTMTEGNIDIEITPKPKDLPDLFYESCKIKVKEDSTCSKNFKTSEIETFTIQARNSFMLAPDDKGDIRSHNVYSDPIKITTMEDAEPVNLVLGDQILSQKTTDTEYVLLEPLGSFTTFNTEEKCALARYLNIMFKIIIGISATLAVVMLVYGGIEYIKSASISEKSSGKDIIVNAMLGMVILLGSVLLLKTINPQLLNMCPHMEDVTMVIKSAETGQQFFLASKKDPVFKRTKHYDRVKELAKDYTIPECLLQVAVQRESRGNPEAIGHDEDVPSEGIGARNAFIKSGKKFLGGSFEFTGTNEQLIIKKELQNDDHTRKPGEDLLGVDPRFSHGFGLLQVTFFPNNHKHGPKYRDGITLKSGRIIKPKDLMEAEIALQAGAKIMKDFYKQCGGDILKTFTAYGSGGCISDNIFILKEAPDRLKLYNQCLKQL